jgi:hypothetical protein
MQSKNSKFSDASKLMRRTSTLDTIAYKGAKAFYEGPIGS